MTGPIHKLNRSYLDQLKQDPENSAFHLEQLRQFLINRGCTFRGEPMPTLLKPNFISQKQTDTLVSNVEMMSGILNKFVHYYLKNEDVRKIMKFTDRENELFFIEPGYEKPLVISRLDAFLNDYSIKFLEFNCDSPAGIAYSDVLEEGFYEIFKEYPFLENWKIQSIRRQELLLASLLKCYREFRETMKGKSGSGAAAEFPENPLIAIVDWEDVSTYSEFKLHQEHFRREGYETIITSPAKFTIKNGRAFAGGREINLVYRRVISRELLQKPNETHEFVKCIREGLVCCCNSFRSYIVGNKKVLSIISDSRFQGIYTDEEIAAIRETIPWTQILADSIVSYEGREVHLKDFVLENKQKLVLKPANMYGGKDVHIGHVTETAAWRRLMDSHIRDESWVVQEYVEIPQEVFPETAPGTGFKSKYVNINPFALQGKYSGTITRVSDHLVINVSAGGGLVPTFTAIEKSPSGEV